MAEPSPIEERIWERGWDGHVQAQRRRLAALPLSARLEWLEQAQRLVNFLGRRAITRTPGDESGG